MGGGSDDSAEDAAWTQYQQLEKSIEEQRAAYQDALGLFQPYRDAGNQGLQSYLGLLGLNGADAQQQAISGLQNTPGYQAQLQAGQRAILQNAAATGGLRGGNVQQGLAEFGSGLFGNYYQNQLAQLGNLQQQGFNAATNLSNVRAGAAGGISNAYSAQGDALAQGELASAGGGWQGMLGGALSGASAGSTFGPIGTIGGGILGALGGK